MKPFLQEFYELVNEKLGDPSFTRRTGTDALYRDLITADAIIWEDLLKASGQQSTIGRGESEISFVANQAFYQLPGNFRQFIEMVKWSGGDRNAPYARLGTVPYNQSGAGIEIIDAEHGFIVRPVPVEDDTEPWTLIYSKGTINLHYGVAAEASAKGLSGCVASINGGEMMLVDDYYNTSMIHIVSAETGAGQSRECVASRVVGGKTSFIFRHAWNPTPTGTIVYEVRPSMPRRYQEIYALYVAIKQCPKRRNPQLRSELESEARELFSACLRYFTSNTADRPPERLVPHGANIMDPYEGM